MEPSLLVLAGFIAGQAGLQILALGGLWIVLNSVFRKRDANKE